ncbi:MAG: phytanoyl-CoA dioxygenase family protein [Candidatus Hydrogenedentes bacterium]|nr:phytanoyl-CoA dioxygenase family protein [Candidatus Hydrogenedentota bacterium]
MTHPPLTKEQLAQFERDGYVLVENLLDKEETDLLLKIAKADQGIQKGATARKDARGNYTRLTLRNELYDDMYSAIVRSPRIVDRMEQLLGGEVYHYHHKMMLKEPRVGGAWEWHQDYGYWYNNGCLFPYMASCLIAVDRATKENGCLQVIRGSHLMGRVDHVTLEGGQTSADPERVEKALERMELVYCEMAPGAGLFFHGNLLHRSDMNASDYSRWSLICCYNAARNDPYKVHHHPNYSYLEKWPDSKIKEIGQREWAEMQAATT